jgi:Cof subfamily protein (haloacid dehalogenase superfamily)
MPHKYKLLVSDIDDTLADGRGVISAADKKALLDLHRAGIKVSLCTGRPAKGCKAVLQEMPTDGFHVFFDGALVCNSNQTEIIYSRPIKKELLGEICALAQEHGLTLELFSSTCFYVEQEHTLAQIHSDLLNFETTEVYFSAVCQQVPIIMGCLVIPAEDENKFKPMLADFGGKRNLVFSWTMNPTRPDIRLVNIIMDDVSKGRALEALCVYLGLELKEVAAIGDGANDISLLSTAGLAIAMQNAPPQLKAAADYITPDLTHDGFAQEVHKHLL